MKKISILKSGILDAPLLYLSDFFEKNKTLYYDNLTFVRTKNDLIQWIRFFLTGIVQTAEKSVETLGKIIEMKGTIERETIMHLGKRSKKALELFHQLFKNPIVTIKDVQRITGLSVKAAGDMVQIFVDKKILMENTGFKRNRVFMFDSYLKLF